MNGKMLNSLLAENLSQAEPHPQVVKTRPSGTKRCPNPNCQRTISANKVGCMACLNAAAELMLEILEPKTEV